MALMTAAKVLTVIGTAVSAYGQYQTYQQQSDLEAYNAEVSEAQAEQVRLETSEKAKRQRKSNDSFQEEQRAAFAKAGITDTGTPLSVMSQTAADLELATLDIAYQGESQAQQLMQQSAVNKMQSKAFKSAQTFAVGTTVLNGGNQLARLYL